MTELWCEGNPKLDHTAMHLGYSRATDMREACLDIASRWPYFNDRLDLKRMTYDGCRIFFTEAEARESHG